MIPSLRAAGSIVGSECFSRWECGSQLLSLHSVWKLFLNQPAQRAALLAFCLALTVLLPHAIYSEVDGWHRAYFVGPALWLWLCAIATDLAVTRVSLRE
jgi:hypothetical protein